jgi:hypothetical protein
MLITILPKEIDLEPWKLAYVHNLHIDYYTNSIHGVFENKEVILYNFNKCGWINDNRQNSYDISCGLAGIFIQIKPNN